MRVLVLSQYFWPETFRITEVAHSLREAGCEVTVLTGQPNYPDGVIAPGYRALSLRTERRDGLTIHRVPLAPRGRGGAVRLALNYLSFIVSAAVFGPWTLRGTGIDVILVYAPSPILQAIPAVWLAFLKKARLVTWVQDLWPDSLRATGFVRNETALAAIAEVVRWIYERNDLLLVQSRAFVEPVRALGGDDRVAYFPNPGERAFTSSVAATDEPAFRLQPGFNIVFAGNLGTVQALETIVAAAALLRDLPDVRFVIIGSGSRAAWLRAEAERLGLANVQMPGRFAPEAIPGILAQAGALLVTLSRSPILAQTIPSKVQAYLAAGRPIIASLDGEGAALIGLAGAGIGCAAEDPAALAAAVRSVRALSEPERHLMGARGRAYYDRHFDPALLARRMMATFQRVLRGDQDAATMAGTLTGTSDDR